VLVLVQVQVQVLALGLVLVLVIEKRVLVLEQNRRLDSRTRPIVNVSKQQANQ
jgi:hypothetical protein